MMMVCMGLCGPNCGSKEVVLRNYVRLAQGELPVEDVEELSLYAADIALPEQSCPRCPIDILRRCIIDILNGQPIRSVKKKRHSL